MLSFVLAAAAQVSAPVPLNLKGWVSPTDMPELPGGRGFWMVGVDLLVDTDGTLRGCTIERTSTIAALDKLTCDLIHKRARFRPAQWADGSPVTGVYRTSVGYSQGDGSDMPWLYGYDLEVRVKSLPSACEIPPESASCSQLIPQEPYHRALPSRVKTSRWRRTSPSSCRSRASS